MVFIPTGPQREQELREAKLATELPRTSENTRATQHIQERENGLVLDEPEKNRLCPPWKALTNRERDCVWR